MHGRERTYAVIAALRSPPFEGGVVAVYRRIESALQSALRSLGVDRIDEYHETPERPADPHRPGSIAEYSCFQESAAHETTVSGRKLIGSAQLRRRSAFLQHGALPLEGSERTARIFGIDTPRFTDLGLRLGRIVSSEEMDAAWVAGFTKEFDAKFAIRPLDVMEREQVVRRESRYVSLR